MLANAEADVQVRPASVNITMQPVEQAISRCPTALVEESPCGRVDQRGFSVRFHKNAYQSASNLRVNSLLHRIWSSNHGLLCGSDFIQQIQIALEHLADHTAQRQAGGQPINRRHPTL